MALAGLAGVVAVTGAGATKVVAAYGEGRTNCSAQSVVQVAAPSAIADAVRHAADQVEARGDVCASCSVSSSPFHATVAACSSIALWLWRGVR